jgi:hypothetical protein
VNWQGRDALARSVQRFSVLQDGGQYDTFADVDQARQVACNLAHSGAGGVWTVLTDTGVEVGLYLYQAS